MTGSAIWAWAASRQTLSPSAGAAGIARWASIVVRAFMSSSLTADARRIYAGARRTTCRLAANCSAVQHGAEADDCRPLGCGYLEVLRGPHRQLLQAMLRSELGELCEV